MSDQSQDGVAPAADEPEVGPEAPGAELPAAAGAPAGSDAQADGTLKEILEALIFVHRGILPPKTVREVLGEEFTAEEIAAGFEALKRDYDSRGGALALVEVAGGWQFGTRAELAPWVRKLDFYEHHRHLSRPTLETLAIIAYKQPVTRAEIEAIRGVNAERIVRNLIERKLVRVLGHKDVPGKPMVLGTSREFLELFGLNSLADLPPLKDFVEPPAGEAADDVPALPLFGGGGDEPGDAADAETEQEADDGSEHAEGEGGAPAPGDGGGPAAGEPREG